MDGTLVDSEKIWTLSMADLAAHLGGTISTATRAKMIGSNLPTSVAMLHRELGLGDADARADGRWLLQRTKQYFSRGLPWQPGARALLEEVHAAGIPTALVTSTYRELVDVALRTIGEGYFDVTVCGDEVAHNKPHPQAYLDAARKLGVEPRRCLAVEDSPTGVAAATDAGCVVLAVPSEVPVADAPGRAVVPSLQGVGLDTLERVFARHGAAAPATSPGCAYPGEDIP